jgi:hypothetical protein
MVSVHSGAASEGCKLRLPTTTTLLAITGRATLTPSSSDVEIWNGLNSANELFRAEDIKSEEIVQQKETFWLNSLQSAIALVRLIPRPEQNTKIVVSLNIFTFISGNIRIFRVGLYALNGKFVPFSKEVTPLPKEQTQVLPFGKISVFDESSLDVRMNQSEHDRYRVLMNDQRPRASSVKELRALTLSLEELGSDIDGRTATANEPAEIAGPFSSATFDSNQGRWQTYPAGPCRKFIEQAPVKKRMN